MAYKAPLFTELDFKEEKVFLRQAYYWALIDQRRNKARSEQKCVLIFSSEQRAKDFAKFKNLEHVPCVMFWEELDAYFGGEFMQAVVNVTGHGADFPVLLDLYENASEEEDDYVSALEC